LNSFDAARRAAAGYFLLLVQEKVTKEKDTPKAAETPLRFSPKAGPAKRHIPVPLVGSRSRREPRYARPLPPSSAMLGGYGAQGQNSEQAA